MKVTEIENALLAQALEIFQRETGLPLKVIQEQADINGLHVDAILEAPQFGGRLAVEIKKWAPQANLGVLVSQVKKLPIEGLLVADYVNPKMAEKLKDMDVQFIDTAGNAYINRPPVYILITGNKLKPLTKSRGSNRAFDATGLKVVYGFLCNAQLVNASYREIAEQTGVALGTVGWVVNGLKAAGFIIDRVGKKNRRIVSRRKLLDRWVEAYPEKLKPKQLMGVFVAEDPYWWKGIKIEECGAYWGGEIAASQYTDYLKPQTATVYLPERAGNKLLMIAKLRKAVDWTDNDPGIVSVYRPFWPERLNDFANGMPTASNGVVSPILTYAELMATGDSRNIETAGMIYEQHIAQHLGED
ncbi:type IV toxin-antitoxin system AbiEi family antitoxin [Motiliproteus sp. MSK22-1]|uniref:type IV toxin-antitoxin system AbiEi family antitoxin n=1 Tax=Motiliproteus sp. MSK22-1 TaxID=1897630 RepID=UPI00097738D7|nr:type IV toxin-antitoxin system AbiEi family antitoxin [Motiliproteus sp. MSK22-1]OMH39408.1 hypothetical protein BGP75_03620 [Motiliproteus sp. MSK22-1]